MLKIVTKDQEGIHLLPGRTIKEVLDYLYRLQVLDGEKRLFKLPCRIGDKVWCVRTLSRHRRFISSGAVTEILIDEAGMWIKVKNLHKGKFGDTVFVSADDAQDALERMEEN